MRSKMQPLELCNVPVKLIGGDGHGFGCRENMGALVEGS